MQGRRKNMRYSIAGNLKYIWKKEFSWYHQLRYLFPLRIIVSCIHPIIETAIPALVVSIVSKQEGGKKLVIYLCGSLLLCLVLSVLRDYATQWVDKMWAWCRCQNFNQMLIRNAMEKDYCLLEQEEMQTKMSMAARAIGRNYDGIEGMTRSFDQLLIGVVGIIGYTGIIVSMDIRIFLVLVLMCIVNVFLSKKASEYLKKHSEEDAKVSKQCDYLYRTMTDYRDIKDIILFRMSTWFCDEFDKLCNKKRKINNNIEKVWSYPEISDAIFMGLKDGVAYYILIGGVLAGNISIAMFTFYIGIINGFSGWLFQIVGAIGDLKRDNILVNSFREVVIEHEQNSVVRENAKDSSHQKMGIKFDKVSFTYASGEQKVLDNISFEIEAGEKIALVGENGAGKSTLIKILTGLYKNFDGEVWIGSKKYNADTVKDFSWDDVTVVYQDSVLLAFSVGENIACKPWNQVDETRVERTLKKIGLHKKISQLPQGIHTRISKIIDRNGVDFSGGEGQKLLLARSLYQDGNIIILDEPTSALDPIAEKKLYEDFSDLVNGRTAIFVSHRLATTKFCDRTIVLKRGLVIEEGTHDELMKKQGEYARMYQAQSKYYK